MSLGRRNRLFAGSDSGGARAAAIYSRIETCKPGGIDPFAWLRDTLARIAAPPIPHPATGGDQPARQQ